MAQIIDKIIRQPNAPNSTNVMWDNGEGLFINRNGSWQSVGGSSSGGSEIVTKVVALDRIFDDSEYLKELYQFYKNAYNNNIIVNSLFGESGFIYPTYSLEAGLVGVLCYYNEDDDVLEIGIVMEVISNNSYSANIVVVGPSTDFLPVVDSILPELDTSHISKVQYISEIPGDTNYWYASINYINHLLMLKEVIWLNDTHKCYLYEGNTIYTSEDSIDTFFGFTGDNKILKIEVSKKDNKTLSSTLFDLNSLITTT